MGVTSALIPVQINGDFISVMFSRFYWHCVQQKKRVATPGMMRGFRYPLS